MSIGLLDLNDSNLQLWHESTVVQSPGYALFQRNEYLFGTPARSAARLQPRDINTRYWWQLSTESLQPALGPARHTGDLVHSHLLELHREANSPKEILLAVPGSMQHAQLALLLGIVQQCPFDAVGLVNRSVALGSLYPQRERLFHLEIQLHQAVISELVENNGHVELQRTTPIPGCGLLQLQERLVELIAAAFVRQTRFDPRRKAATEQQLYDALPAALRTLQSSSETNLEVHGYQARISAHELQAAGKRLFDSARETIGVLHPDDHLIVDPLTALLPGLTSMYEQLDILQADDIYHALQSHQELLIQREQALSFVTALPCLSRKNTGSHTQTIEPQQLTPAPPVVPVVQPTHVLNEHTAQPLIETGTALIAGWELYRNEEGWQLRGNGDSAMVNGVAYRSGQTLACGDVIAIGEYESLQLIEVVA